MTSSPVIPSPRVAPRCKLPSTIRQCDRQTVDFWFADVREVSTRENALEPGRPRVEVGSVIDIA